MAAAFPPARLPSAASARPSRSCGAGELGLIKLSHAWPNLGQTSTQTMQIPVTCNTTGVFSKEVRASGR